MQNAIFRVLIAYAWGLAMFVDADALVDLGEQKGSLLYIATVAPTVLYVIVSAPAFLRAKWQMPAVALLIFMVAVTGVSIARLDFATALSIGALCAMLIAILHSRVTVGVTTVNVLFAFSIMAAAVMTAAGVGQYALWPGTDDWRVSLFPYNVTPSWLFSLIIIGMNYFHNRCAACKWIVIPLALYFMIASGSRTGMIVLALCIAFLACTRVAAFRNRLFYRLFIPLVAAAFVVTLNAESLLLILAGSDNAIANTLLFKSDAGVSGTEEASASIVRTLLWAEHLQIFSENPWIGHGTFVLQDIANLEGVNSSGTEAFITGLFARTGVLALLFIAFIYLLAVQALRHKSKLGFCLTILLSISSLAYGSYLVPYDFIFLLLFGAMNSVWYIRRRPTVLDPVRTVIVEVDAALEPGRRTRPRGHLENSIPRHDAKRAP